MKKKLSYHGTKPIQFSIYLYKILLERPPKYTTLIIGGWMGSNLGGASQEDVICPCITRTPNSRDEACHGFWELVPNRDWDALQSFRVRDMDRWGTVKFLLPAPLYTAATVSVGGFSEIYYLDYGASCSLPSCSCRTKLINGMSCVTVIFHLFWFECAWFRVEEEEHACRGAENSESYGGLHWLVQFPTCLHWTVLIIIFPSLSTVVNQFW